VSGGGPESAPRGSEAEHRETMAMLAHELRNPLGSLRTALEVLELETPADLRRRMLTIAKRQVSQLSRLVDDILDSSAAGERLVVHRRRIDIVALVRDLVESQRPVFSQAGLRLVVELPDEEVALDGDSVRLAQVLDNLLGNAAKFTPAGGEVRVSLVDGGDGEVRLVVSDTGDGIEESELGTVFEPFRRGRGERAAGGLGLGLAIVRRLVEAHGGSVEARSDGRGQGTKLLVRLPLATALAPSRREDGAGGVAPGPT
jgi:signal transduction histidine kinase